MRPRLVVLRVVAVVVLGLGACGGGDDAADLITGRVMSVTSTRVCVSPDRGATSRCVEVPDPKAIEGVDVGECVRSTVDLASEGSRIEVVPDATCAAGDAGD